MHPLITIARPHIMAIAAVASLVFGWLLTGRFWWALPFVVALDWFLVNLMNRVADLAEDKKNQVPGTAWVDQHALPLTVLSWIVLLGSFPALHAVLPALTLLRAAFQLIGLAYNFKLIPAWKAGRFAPTRFKELYFFKNTSSAFLFVLSGLLYPAALSGYAVEWPRFFLLCAFFFPLELTYEILYDLRDVAGDEAEGVPTFPVVHGIPLTHRLLEVLLALSAASLLAGFALGPLRFRELVLIAAPVQQALFFELELKRSVSQAQAVGLTWLGAAQSASYCVWVLVGLPLGP
jgi:4-hydroxybenzoate polyprenyltransferase